jgi:hypothetical protein
LATISETKQTLRKSVVESYREEYKEYANYWRNLEAKAQGNVAVAGIFIAGSFAFITRADPTLNVAERFFLLLSMGVLFLSVVFSVLVLKIRRLPAPPLGSFADYSVRHILEVNAASFHERLRRFNNDHLNMWRNVTRQMVQALQVKADRLWVAQYLLITAILIVAMLAAARIITLLS